MNKDSWPQALTGVAVTLVTAAVVAVFTKVYDSAEKQADLQARIAVLEAKTSKLDELLDHERLENARTRAMCERWGVKIRNLVPE